MTDPALQRAVAPTLFDVVVDPALAFTLVLANLMSPRLWEMRERVLHDGETIDEPVRRIQEFLDHHFEHVTCAQVAEMNGVLDVDVLAERYGTHTVEYVLGRIVASLERRVESGTIKRDASALDLFGQRKFPVYNYATIDEAWACRRLLRRRKHKPWGLTCCLDEAAIFIALHLALAQGAAGDVAILGAPTHYSVLIPGDRGPWWMYGKHVLFAPADWSRLVQETTAGDSQRAFDDRMLDFDRVISPAGSWSLVTGESSIPEKSLSEIIGRIDSLFGCRLAQLDQGLQRHVRFVESSGDADLMASVASASGPGAVHEAVRRAGFEGSRVALRALHAFRALDVPDPGVYLEAARHTSHPDSLLPDVKSADDALRAVAAIAGTSSIFDDGGRIAMPDETVRFGTGTLGDKALLLHVLLERSCAPLETVVGEADSFVCGSDFCISLATMARVATPEGRVVHRISG